MPDCVYELKLASGRVVRWDGASPEDASRNYAISHPGETVIAWRWPDRHGIFVLGSRLDRVRILEPGDRGW